MSGLSLEALNDIGQRQTQMLIVAQRQRDVDQPDRRGVLEVPEPDQALEHVAPQQERLRPDRRADPRGRRARPRAQSRGCGRRSCGSPSPASSSRTSGSPTSASSRATTSTRCSRPSGAPWRCPVPSIVHVRTQKGRGYPAGRDRPGRVPRRGPAADARRDSRPSRCPTTPRRRHRRSRRRRSSPTTPRSSRRS